MPAAAIGSPDNVIVFADLHRPLLPSWQVLCFTVNCVMGSGFLGVPAAFATSGIALGVLVLLLVTVGLWAAACMLTEVAARAHALLTEQNVATWLTPTLASFSSGGDTRTQGKPALMLPSHVSYEVCMLCRLLVGQSAERWVTLSIVLYMMGTLWSFISVFASSLSATVPLPLLVDDQPCDLYRTSLFGGGCIHLYYAWLGVFFAAMCVMTLYEVREQVTFQVAMTVLRVTIICMMVATLIWGETSEFDLEPTADPLPLARFDGLAPMLPIAVFCQLFQIAVPTLLEPAADKRAFRTVFGGALTITFGMYSVYGIACVLFFGAKVDPSSNLMWSSYSNRAIGLSVALFPALDTLSVFPMNISFLSNNLMAVVLGKRWHSGDVSRRTRVYYRLLCVVPPFVCAAAFPSLAKALGFTGLVGITLPFVVTPILHVASLKECHARWGKDAFDRAEAEAGFATWVFSSPGFVRAFGAAGILLLLFCVASGLVYGF